ncbi:40S ribosomal protein S15 [Pseudoloma neurophilia]|uniref:40S ribosomal protein S15 n=1 Tax=Pseudoloma neurophilia TaxID=146866 RepID=A0A0R0LXH3_9MICR|nr:40S ribosomal protein S15 [Pseudoloma neurophilia]
MEQQRRRTFKKFTFQGIDLEDLLTMKITELRPYYPSALRRHMKRGFSQDEYNLIKQCEAGASGLKTQCRNMMVLPCMFNKVIGIHNGCQFVEVEIKPEMIARRFKDLVPTKTSKAHGKPGVGATSSSKFVPLK